MRLIEPSRVELLRSPYGIALLLALILSVGCGKSGIERAVVSGAVSYRTAPIEKGEIAFVPENQQPTTIARITQGEYRIVAKGGVPVGAHKVQIKAFRTESTPHVDLAVGDASGQFLPSRYNKESELRVTIEPGQEEITHDFHLK